MSAIYVSGFTFEDVGEGDARREAFNTAFGGYGEITRVKVGGRDKPYAFVTFSDEESRDNAVAAGFATVGSAECEVAAQTSVTKTRKVKQDSAPKRSSGFAIYVSGFTLDGIGEGKEAFNAAFGGYGEITRVKLGGRDKPFAFVTFSDEESRDNAVAAGSATVGGAECEVDAEKQKKRIPPGFAMYVSGFAFENVGEGDARTEVFNAAFGGYGEITDVKVGGRDKPFAFVTFSDEESRDNAVAAGAATVGGAECTVDAQAAKAPRKRRPRKRAVESEEA